MSTDAIKAHHTHLQERGLDLGSARGDEQNAGFGGVCQVYERGRIYWHPSTGAHELHGRVLQRYLDSGGHDINPATGERELGFPTSDHTRTEDGLYECATFEQGTISDVSGTPLVRLFGRLHEAWRAGGGALGRLGHPLTDVVRIEGGRAAWFERGVLWHAEGSADVLVGQLVPPLLGQPAVVNPDTLGPFEWMRFDGAVAVLDVRPALAAALMKDRLSLVPVGGGVDPSGGLATDASPDAAAAPHATGGSGNFTVLLGLGLTSTSPPAAQKATIVHLVPALVVSQRDGQRRLGFMLPSRSGGRFPHLQGTFDPAVLGRPRTKLERRQLYSLAFRNPGTALRVISPHCLYARSDWENFGIAHITDLHVSRRIDAYRAKLRAARVPEEDVARFNNWNDAFRDFIRYANHLHAAGLLDVIIATGDLVDYVREVDDHPEGPGNFGFFEALVQGQAPGRDAESPKGEALRVPIYTSLGNHDYRQLPYALGFDLSVQSSDVAGIVPIVGDLLKAVGDGVRFALNQVPGLGVVTSLDIVDLVSSLGDTIWNHRGLNTTHDEALRLMGLTLNGKAYLVPRLRPAGAAKPVRPDPAMRNRTHYYFRRLNPDPSYVVRLGTHRVVMLDTRWDEGITDEVSEALLTKLGFGSESQENFVGGEPNSVGVSASELEQLLRGALNEEEARGLVIVGMHAPPLNPHGTALWNCLRESVHPTNDPAQVTGWLRRHVPSELTVLRHLGGGSAGAVVQVQPSPNADRKRLGWTRTGTLHFHVGPIEDLLDYGIAVGQKEALAQLLAGKDAVRPVTMVCSGHGHTRVEYRLRWKAETGQLEVYTDHYFANPNVYYPTRRVEGNWWDLGSHKRYLVRLRDGAPPAGEVGEKPFEGSIWEGTTELHVPPYPTPLSGDSNLAAWWKDHAPVVVQTAALGPCVNTRATVGINKEAPGPNFQGFRLMQVIGNMIARAHYIKMDDLRGAAFPLAWESGAAQPEPTHPVIGVFKPGFFVQVPLGPTPPTPGGASKADPNS